MKKQICIGLALALMLSGCQSAPEETDQPETTPSETQVNETTPIAWAEATHIAIDGSDVYVEAGAPVSVDHDIVYYQSGQDLSYGAGDESDSHDPEEAENHTVIHITGPGTYRITGQSDAAQIAVDLGEDAKSDPTAVVNLVLDGVDLTCTVAPAIIFYRVYECGSDDTQTAQAVVDTSQAGANIILADGSDNTVHGSYVAKIYKPESVELSEDGTKVESAKKLHKYDGAVYSKVSMNVSGGEVGDGKLTIYAENEGLDSELHLTINGGDIRIISGDDGINTNEDGVSVTTINGGNLTIQVTGEKDGEGDGIDSNGYLVINGGTVIAAACGKSMDSGIDSDMGIFLNGGTVIASGNMLDQIEGGDSTYAVFSFTSTVTGGQELTLKNQAGETVLTCTPANNFQHLVIASPDLAEGEYTLYLGDTQLSGYAGGMGMGGMGFPGGMGGGMEPNLGTPGNVPGQFNGEPPQGDFQIPEQPGTMEPQDGEMPTMPDGQMDPKDIVESMPQEPPQGMGDGMPEEPPQDNGDQMPGEPPQGFGGNESDSQEVADTFPIVSGGNQFTVVLNRTN